MDWTGEKEETGFKIVTKPGDTKDALYLYRASSLEPTSTGCDFLLSCSDICRCAADRSASFALVERAVDSKSPSGMPLSHWAWQESNQTAVYQPLIHVIWFSRITSLAERFWSRKSRLWLTWRSRARDISWSKCAKAQKGPRGQRPFACMSWQRDDL